MALLLGELSIIKTPHSEKEQKIELSDDDLRVIVICNRLKEDKGHDIDTERTMIDSLSKEDKKKEQIKKFTLLGQEKNYQ